jgi:peptidyl-prolyl cis-trans isomerase SurA
MIASTLLAAALAAAPARSTPAPPQEAPAPAPQRPSDAPPGPGKVIDRVAATVNGDPVTLVEMQERGGGELARVEAQPAGAARDAARQRTLRLIFDALVAERLLDGQAAALGVDVSEAQVDSAIDEIKRRNNLDDAKLDEVLPSQGFADRASFRRAIKRDLETAAVLNVKVRSRIKITDEDVKNYWQTHQQEFRAGDEVKVRHIFVSMPASATAADEASARGRAEKALARVHAGEDFSKVAREMSDGPTAKDGGELGWYKRGVLQPDVEKAAFALARGQTSGLVRSSRGFQILQVEDRRGGGARPLDEVKESIRDTLYNQQLETYRNQFVAELKKDAIIDVKMPELKQD